MSYPPPPGLKNSQSSSSSSLPPRPPPSANHSSFPGSSSNNGSRAFGGNSGGNAGGASGGAGTGGGRGVQGGGGYTAFTGFQPRSVMAGNPGFRTNSPSTSNPAAPRTNYSTESSGFPGGQYQTAYQQPSTTQVYYQHQLQQSQNPQSSQAQASYEQYPQQQAPPQIRNPFPLPGQAQGGPRPYGAQIVDPEMEAQIAQWQSAYISKEDSSGRRTFAQGATSAMGAGFGQQIVRGEPSALSNSDLSSAANPDSGVASVVTGADGKQKTVVRSGGGQSWQDPSLLDWDPAHFRLFVGNLAGEVTDDSLLKAFSRYLSVQKAKVIRDKRTTKSKGYGFVSFSDGDEYFEAAREMQGKYIGSHPVRLRKSTTEIRPTVPKDNRKKNSKGHKADTNGSIDRTGAGIQKKQSKTKGGLKILG